MKSLKNIKETDEEIEQNHYSGTAKRIPKIGHTKIGFLNGWHSMNIISRILFNLIHWDLF